MKIKIIICNLLLAVLGTSCVQKAYKKTVVFTLQTPKMTNIEKVGIRGNDQPLSWDTDFPMQVLKKDSLYQGTVTFVTGYRFTEVKFVINDNFELQNQENRKIILDSKDTTFCKLTFNQR